MTAGGEEGGWGGGRTVTAGGEEGGRDATCALRAAHACVFAGRGEPRVFPGPAGGWHDGGTPRVLWARIRRAGGPFPSPAARPVRGFGALAGRWGATARGRWRRCCLLVCWARGCCYGVCSETKRRSTSDCKQFSPARSRTQIRPKKAMLPCSCRRRTEDGSAAVVKELPEVCWHSPG